MTAVAVPAADLTDVEAAELVEAERAIERGLRTFVEVGQALAAIRDGRLYRTDHPTFEDYCSTRWALSRPRAYELMSAARVVSAIADTGYRPPANEAQARELARVPEAERSDVWREARERSNGRPTAATVRDVVRERQAPPATPDTDPIVLRYSDSAQGWVVGPAGAAPHSVAGLGIPQDDVAAAQMWAGDQVWEVELREVIRWQESTTTDGAWMAVLADDASPRPAPAAVGEQYKTDPVERAAAVAQVAPEFVRPAPEPQRPPAWDPEELRQHAEHVQRIRDIEAARRASANVVTEVLGLVVTIVSGSRLGEPGLVTADMIRELREAIDLLEGEL